MPTHSLGALLGDARRIAVVEEAHGPHGFSAELGGVLLESGYAGPYLRIATPPVPIPAARSLEADVIPNEAFVVEQVTALFEREIVGR